MKMSDAILEQFEPDVAIALIEFGKALPRIDADLFMFMARKSLCLYDVLLRLGSPPIEKTLISDRILDMRLDFLRGKRVALIDDSLILGTTLAKAKRQLQTEADAQVTCHAFCVDIDWWCPDLIVPESVYLRLDDRRVMTFCTGEVRALSLVPRPYLVDFPLSRPVRIKQEDLQLFLTGAEWSSHRLTSGLQERNSVEVFSFFPRDRVAEDLRTCFGEDIYRTIQIAKVRAFGRRYENVFWFQLVPIVVLHPLTEEVLSRVLEVLLKRFPRLSGPMMERLRYHAHTPQAQQRLTQYCMSALVGARFMIGLQASIDEGLDVGFDSLEADRHYGPWLKPEIDVISSDAMSEWTHQHSRNRRIVGMPVGPSKLPDAVSERITRFLDVRVIGQDAPRESSDEERPINLVSALTEVFLHLYNTQEIPARQEAKELGQRIFTTTDRPLHLDRLEMGIPWSVLVDYFGRRTAYRCEEDGGQLFSLVLDVCNDLGVSVPVTCLDSGVVFRGYRHGEDVRFSDGELSLAYEAVRGLLAGAHQDAITGLTLEKLLVILIRIGAARKFLEPIYGVSGVEGIAKIAFSLHGAVPVLYRGPMDRADNQVWLSQYLVERGVLRPVNVDAMSRRGPKYYQLGTQVQGNYLVSNAPDEAYEVGNILGRLLARKRDPRHKDGPLDFKSLIILATCWPPRHTAGAIEVELDIFQRWYRKHRDALFGPIERDDMDSLPGALSTLVTGSGHQAVHSAHMKYVGYKTAQPQAIVEACTEFLERTQGDELPARKWRSYWRSLQDTEVVGERGTFDPWIDRCASVIWEIGAYLYALELAMRAKMLRRKPDGRAEAELRETYDSFVAFNVEMRRVGLQEPSPVVKMAERFRRLAGGDLSAFDHDEAIFYAQRNLDALLPRVIDIIERLEPVVATFGRLYGRHDYALMLYYDIIDSTGTRAVEAGIDLESYRNSVRRYKALVNDQLWRLQVIARKNACEVYPTRGDVRSMDDCKHIFVSGKFAQRYASECLSTLMQSTCSFPGVHIRAYFVPCNFAGSTAYKMSADTEVAGERFWEHWSRVLRGTKKFEEECGYGSSFLGVIGAQLAKDYRPSMPLFWENPRLTEVTSAIEGLENRATFRYGKLGFSEP